MRVTHKTAPAKALQTLPKGCHQTPARRVLWDCFFALARCDTCFVNPQRCHFALGTCREPDWGMQTCMQPHVVYLANSGGLKVGLTQDQKQQQRWLSQGATQGLVIARATSRRAAGIWKPQLRSRLVTVHNGVKWSPYRPCRLTCKSCGNACSNR